MAIFKCKMCGGDLDVHEGMTVCECEFCGTSQTIPTADDERKTNLFNRATQLRRANEFDRAIAVYEQLISEFPDEAEAYWGMVLCKYGIEYVDDPLTYRKIPTCHRTAYESIFDDINYKQAIKKADPVALALYQKEAETISDIQKGILRIVKNEKPFDIFICYKETDDSGERTQDSVLAQDLYYQLTDAGFKVFFSRITLEGKLGTQYEPYIFAALNSARVMVVVGTKPEYFNAVWLKNEWGRFLALMKQDKNKMLIPAYRDMDPYDLPDALSMFQAQDMSKLGFMQDLVRGIKKVVGADEKAPVQGTAQAAVQAAPVNSNAENLLKRGTLALEGFKWDEANGFFEQVLNINAEEPRAYLGKLLAEFQCVNEEQIIKKEIEIQYSDNYKYMMRFGDDKLKERINALRYDMASAVLARARSQNDTSLYDKAYNTFFDLGDYKDSNAILDTIGFEQSSIEYNRASALLADAANEGDSQKLDAARDMLECIAGFKNSDELLQKCDSCKADIDKFNDVYNENMTKLRTVNLYSLNSRCFPTVCSVVNELDAFSNYKKARDLTATCNESLYNYGVRLCSYKKSKQALKTAIMLFSRLGEYKDAPERLKLCKKNLAKIRVGNFIAISLIMVAIIFYFSLTFIVQKIVRDEKAKAENATEVTQSVQN